ncbi:hypothetical protein P9209_24475 [Prescottella defluvii]|nr:hypothetical protein P9209_24475 [Prescottella defluvii]
MIESDENRDLASLVAPRSGRFVATREHTEPYRLEDANGVVVEPVAVYPSQFGIRLG